MISPILYTEESGFLSQNTSLFANERDDNLSLRHVDNTFEDAESTDFASFENFVTATSTPQPNNVRENRKTLRDGPVSHAAKKSRLENQNPSGIEDAANRNNDLSLQRLFPYRKIKPLEYMVDGCRIERYAIGSKNCKQTVIGNIYLKIIILIVFECHA